MKSVWIILVAACAPIAASDQTLDLRVRLGVMPGLTDSTVDASTGPVIEQTVPDLSKLGPDFSLQAVAAFAPEDRLGWVIGGGPFIREHRAEGIRVRAFGLGVCTGPTVSLDPDLRIEAVGVLDGGMGDGGSIAGYDHRAGRYLGWGGRAGLYWSMTRHVVLGAEIGWQRFVSTTTYDNGKVWDGFEITDRGEGGSAGVSLGWRW